MNRHIYLSPKNMEDMFERMAFEFGDVVEGLDPLNGKKVFVTRVENGPFKRLKGIEIVKNAGMNTIALKEKNYCFENGRIFWGICGVYSLQNDLGRRYFPLMMEAGITR